MLSSPAVPATSDPAAPLRLRIVMPTLDEAERLPATLERALEEGDEIVVSDGGSRDATVALARSLGAHVIEGPAGRGLQLERGARLDSGSPWDIVLFLHADTLLPTGAGAGVRQAVADGAVGGGFEVRFDGARRLYRLGDRLVSWRTRLTQCPLGDQAQFVRREVFEQLGGIQPFPILEDLDLARRLKRAGRIAILSPPVSTSSRRYDRQGIVATVALNWTIWALYALGVKPRRLARLYRQIR
ncbi:MAG: TIGR04283 family arsenosugar biosynthesis glycosyltransferase [Acidobacteriota bacterium]